MNKLRQKKQQILRFLFGTFSATALMFTFQACYGPPNRYPEETPEDQIAQYVDEDTSAFDNTVQEDNLYTVNDDGEE